MDWGNKAKTKAIIMYPKREPFILKTIHLEEPLNIKLIDECPDLEWEPEEKKPRTIKTPFGVIWIKSRSCIQISHVKDPNNLEYLEKFVYNLLFRHEKRSFIDWLREQKHIQEFIKDMKGK